MKIGLVIHPYNEEKPAGLGRAIFSLAKNLIENDSDNQYTFFVKGENKKPDIHGSYNFVTLPSHVLWLDAGLKRNEEQDLYIFFTPFMPFFFRPKKAIVVVHDVSYRYLPAHSIRQYMQRLILSCIHKRSLKRADKIIAISNTTKEELHTYFNVLKEKISVVYNGFEKRKEDSSISKKKQLLFVGVLKPRKNVHTLLEGYLIAQRELGDHVPDLCIAGKGSGHYQELLSKIVARAPFPEKITFKGYVSDDELVRLYNESLAFVFPSNAEGFGLPVLEAMSVGLPILTSNEGALKEVSGNAALLVDPRSSESIGKSIVRLVEDLQLRNSLAEKGRERVLQFSWEKAGKEYKHIIKSL